MNNTSDNELPDLIDDHSEDSSEEDFMDNAKKQKNIKEKVFKLKDDGNMYFSKTEYLFAIEKYEKALTVNQDLKDNDTRLDLYHKLKNNIAQCYLKRRLYKDALDAAADAIDADSIHVKSFIRASKAFAAMDYNEYAYGVLKKGMFRCSIGKDEISAEMRMLEDQFPKLSKVKDKNWASVTVKELAEEIKRTSDADRRKNKEAEEKKRQAKEAAAQEEERKLKEEEEEKKRKEEQERIDKIEEERRRAKEQKRKEMEEQIVMTALPKEMSKQIKFTEYLQKGSEAMQNKVALTAFECTSKALEILKTDYDNLDISKNLDEASNPLVVTLRYIHARAAVETNEYDNILIAKENYDLILNHYKVRFPAVYLGLALMYKKLNRYEEARKYAEMGLKYKFNSTTMFWPGFPTQVFMETLREEQVKLLQNLMKELANQPEPDVVCKYAECTSHADQTHILPSENIYLSDPDYRGHIRLVCSDNCRLSYHKTCWQLLKSSYTEEWRLARSPTEKDFVGRQCITPDCEGVSIRVEIYNQDGEVLNIEDAKLMERLEEESKKRKMEEKQRRMEENKKSSNNAAGGAKAKKVKKKKKIGESPPSEDPDSSEHCSAKVNSAEPGLPADATGNPISVSQVDYSKVDLSTATILNKNKHEEGGDALHLDTPELTNNNNNIKKKKAKKQVMSLQEFHAKALGTEITTENDFDSRIQKAKLYNSMIENFGPKPAVPGEGLPGPGPVNHIWNGGPPPSVTNARIYQPSNAGGSVVEVVMPNEETVRERNKVLLDNLYALLKEFGPLHHEDQKIWFMLEDYRDLINSFDGLCSFIYLDTLNRFRQHKDYICLLDDLPRLLRMQNESPVPDPTAVQEADTAENTSDEGEEYTDDESESEAEDDKKRGGDGEDKKWNEIKQLLGMDTGQKVSIDTLPNLKKLSLNSNRTVSNGTQTDVSSIELDDSGLDPFTLAQTNENLVMELQDTKDQLFRVQKEFKVNYSKLKESTDMLTNENARLKNENVKLREQSAKERKIAQDFTEKEKSFKEKNDSLNKKIHQLNVEVENEQKLSFNLNKSMLEFKAEIKTLKIFNIKVEAEYYKKEISLRLEQVNHFLKILEEMRHNPVMAQLTELITKAQVEVDNYSARLIEAQINIDDKLEQMLNNMPQDRCPSLDFDMKRLAMPKLDLNLFMFFLDIKADTDRKLKDAVAARQLLQQQRGVGAPMSPPNMFSNMNPPPLNSLLRPGLNGPLAGLVPPPPSSPLRGDVLMDPPLRQLPSPDGAGRDTPTSTAESAPGFPVGGNRANAFSPPLSRQSGASSPFNTAPPLVRSPTPLHSANQQRPPMGMMQPIGTRPMLPPSSVAGGGPQLMRPQISGGSHIQGIRPPVGMPFRPNLPPQAMPSAVQMKPAGPVPQEGPSGDSSSEPGRKKNEDKLVDKICDKYVGIDREKARSYVKQVRQNNGGKLTGMNIPTILQKVQELASADESKDCSICLCELPERPFVTRCGHQFHKYCLDQWLQQETSGNACPNCREFLTNDQEFPQLR